MGNLACCSTEFGRFGNHAHELVTANAAVAQAESGFELALDELVTPHFNQETDTDVRRLMKALNAADEVHPALVSQFESGG